MAVTDEHENMDNIVAVDRLHLMMIKEKMILLQCVSNLWMSQSRNRRPMKETFSSAKIMQYELISINSNFFLCSGCMLLPLISASIVITGNGTKKLVSIFLPYVENCCFSTVTVKLAAIT